MSTELVDHLDLSSLDGRIGPGDDFYQHVNGTWLASNPVPPEYPAWGSMLELHVRNENVLHELLVAAAESHDAGSSASGMVGRYFSAGMDEEGIETAGLTPLEDTLDGIRSMQTLDQLWDLLPRLQRLGIQAFHALGVSADFDDVDRYLVTLSQGGLGLPEKDYYFRDDDRSRALVAAYLEHVTTQLANAGLGGPEDAESVVALERELAGASLPAEKLRDLSLTLNRFRVDDLAALMPDHDLVGYVRRLGVTSDTVNVNHPAFFEALDGLLSKTPIGTLRTYLFWHVIRTFASALPRVFEDEAFDFYGRKLGGQQQQRARWTRVLATATEDIGEQVSRLFVDVAFSPQAKERCEDLVKGLLAAMARSIESADWMTEPTREEALAKVASFTYKIGYPDVWRDYGGLELSTSSFVENRMMCHAFEYDRRIGRLDQPVDKSEWHMPPHMVNAYYNPLQNEIVFPAGILQPPFFYEDADDAVNFGGIGTVIGHEITHGFDDNGSQFDEMGKKRNWWTDADRTEFEKRADGLAEQFSAYEVFSDLNINGRLTLGENIADLGGVAIAHDALLQTLDGDEVVIGGMSPRQRFFVSYATIWRMNYSDDYLRMLANVDVHSPSRFRVNGPLSNFPPFAEAFDIGSDVPMRRRPEETVKIW